MRSILHLVAASLLPVLCLLPPGAAAPGSQFERIGPFGGDVRSLLISSQDSRVVYVGTADGQVFKSGDYGASWDQLRPGLGVRGLVVDTLVQHPAESDRIIAGGWDLRSNGGGLFESSDGGRSWRRIPLPGSAAVRDMAICRSSPSHWVLGTLSGVLVSSDGGVSWSPAGSKDPGFRNVESVAIDPIDPGTLYAGTWRLAYRSRDFGRSWTRVSTGMYFDSDVFSIAVDPTRPESLFVGACSGVYRSRDRAGSWERLRVVANRYTVRARTVHVDPGEPPRVYAGTTEGLFLSSNSGATWKLLTSPALTVNAIGVDPRNRNRILLATDGQGVLKSEDGGTSWFMSNTGFVHRRISRVIADTGSAGRFYAVAQADRQGSGLYLFDNHKDRWTPVSGRADGSLPEALCVLSLPGESGRLMGTSRGIYHQRDPASGWTKLPGGTSGLLVNDLVSHRGNLYAATSEGIFRASLQRLLFEKPSDPRFAPDTVSLAVRVSGGSRIYAAGSLGVMSSADHGASWELLPSGLPHRYVAESIAVSPANEDHLLAGTRTGLFQSLNGGLVWEKIPDGRMGVDIPSVIFADADGQRVVAVDNTFGGVFVSEDAARSWKKIEDANFRSLIRSIVQDPAKPSVFYLGTHSEGVYRLVLP